MAMRKTPYLRMRYPWTDDTVSVADLAAMAADIDQSLAQTASLAANFSKFSSVSVSRTTAQSITKGTLTAISFNSVQLDNGGTSPLAGTPWYSAATPTRLTAPSACVVLASGFGGMNFTTALGTAGCLEIAITLNGGTAAPNVQGTKWSPIAASVGQTWTSALSMWKLNAGDYLEMKFYWTGTPAGPFSSDNVYLPTFALMMVALPTVP